MSGVGAAPGKAQPLQALCADAAALAAELASLSLTEGASIAPGRLSPRRPGAGAAHGPKNGGLGAPPAAPAAEDARAAHNGANDPAPTTDAMSGTACDAAWQADPFARVEEDRESSCGEPESAYVPGENQRQGLVPRPTRLRSRPTLEWVSAASAADDSADDGLEGIGDSLRSLFASQYPLPPPPPPPVRGPPASTTAGAPRPRMASARDPSGPRPAVELSGRPAGAARGRTGAGAGAAADVSRAPAAASARERAAPIRVAAASYSKPVPVSGPAEEAAGGGERAAAAPPAEAAAPDAAAAEAGGLRPAAATEAAGLERSSPRSVGEAAVPCSEAAVSGAVKDVAATSTGGDPFLVHTSAEAVGGKCAAAASDGRTAAGALAMARALVGRAVRVCEQTARQRGYVQSLPRSHEAYTNRCAVV